MTKRIDYIDIIKGFSILWVVLWHSYYSLKINENNYDGLGMFIDVRMPLFFFLSGLFFRQKKFTKFFKRRLQTLVIPFITFYIIGVIWTYLQYNWLAPALNINFASVLNVEIGTIGAFSEYAFAFIGIFKIHYSNTLPTIANPPLWFLVVLFMVQMIHYVIIKLTDKKWLIIFFAIFFYGISLILKRHQVQGYIIAAGMYYIFYMLGSLAGPVLVKSVENKIYAQRIVMFFLSVMILLSLLPISNGIVRHTIYILRALSFTAITFVIFRYTKNFKIINSLKFFGQHSLEVLVTHVLIMTLVIGSMAKCFQTVFSSLDMKDYRWLCIILVFIICILIEIPIIKFCDRYLPQFLGKKPFTIPHWGKNAGLVKLDDESENRQEAG
jgi:fucose 4-O-acetylase-like acetyltransferase